MKRNLLIVSLFTALFAAGCGEEQTPEIVTGSDIDTSQYILDSEPENAVAITDARAADNDGQEITLVGRIGGKKDPWVDGRAAFTLVDMSKVFCHPEEGCPTPWDYCCAGDLTDFRAFVKLTTPDGKTVGADAQEAFGLNELDTVVVKGTAKRDEDGNLSILANGIFVRPESGGE